VSSKQLLGISGLECRLHRYMLDAYCSLFNHASRFPLRLHRPLWSLCGLLLVMIEGDITLLLAGVLEHSYFSANTVLLGALAARGWLGQRQYPPTSRSGVSPKVFANLRFYRAAKPRMEV